jgi:manganese efflux pump family protein
MYRLRMKQVFNIGVTVGIFHIIMPLFGIVAGRFLSQQFDQIAGYIGGGLLMVLGLQMIISSLRKESESLLTPVGFGLILFALSVSLDSFSVGMSLGIYGAKTWLVLICFGAGAMLMSWIGLVIGRQVQGWIGKYGEIFGGTILVFFSIKLLFSI